MVWYLVMLLPCLQMTKHHKFQVLLSGLLFCFASSPGCLGGRPCCCGSLTARMHLSGMRRRGSSSQRQPRNLGERCNLLRRFKSWVL